MVVLQVDVNGKLTKLYMDNKLHRYIEGKVRPSVNQKDKDHVWLVDGEERSGKSVLATQIAKVCDPSFNIENICMTPDKFKKAVQNANRGQAIVYDEAFTGLSSRAAMSQINRMMVEMFMEMGQKNLIIIIVLPTIFQIDKYLPLHRAKGLFHVYTKNTQRGYWVYFNKKKLQELYIKGKKNMTYKQPRSERRGRFLDQYTIDESEYRAMKAKSLKQKERTAKDYDFKKQRDIAIKVLYETEKYTQTEISSLLEKKGWVISQNTLSEIISSQTTSDL